MVARIRATLTYGNVVGRAEEVCREFLVAAGEELHWKSFSTKYNRPVSVVRAFTLLSLAGLLRSSVICYHNVNGSSYPMRLAKIDTSQRRLV